jgi:hypothetical protein
VHRPVLVLGAAALLSLAACAAPGSSGSTAAGKAATTAPAITPTSTTPTSTALDGTQPYGAVVDLYGDLVGTQVQCTGLSPQVNAALVKAQATCTTPSGNPLALQIWTDAAGRDSGVGQLAKAATAAGQPFCTVVGTGPKAAWSVAAGADRADCTAAATTLGGHTVTG